MSGVEENWQTKKSTVIERTTFLFNNEVMSDVKFVVSTYASNVRETPRACKEAKMVIPAHKFVLAISSPVFHAMFYGKMAETTDSVELPDCEYESVLEMLRYLYSDRAELNGSNVMQVFYLAKKYMVPSLADKCSKYLRENIDGSNVFSILLHAKRFEENKLEDRCWQVIKTQAAEAVTSDEFVTLERPLVKSVVKKERLFVKEVELFKAVDCWATKEIERQGLTLDGNIKRQVLGEEIVKALRFPLMSQKEFASVVPDSNILTLKELSDMIKYYSDVLETPLPFIQTPRVGSLLRCFRFQGIDPPSASFFGHDSETSLISVTTSKPVFLHGVQMFGSEGGMYTVDVEVFEIIKNSFLDFSLVNQRGSHVSESFTLPFSREMKTHGYGYDVMFPHPVCLENTKNYKIKSTTKGPPSLRGAVAIPVESAGVTFTFNSEGIGLLFCHLNNQFPALIFSL